MWHFWLKTGPLDRTLRFADPDIRWDTLLWRLKDEQQPSNTPNTLA